jgi:hypothetical protein
MAEQHTPTALTPAEHYVLRNVFYSRPAHEGWPSTRCGLIRVWQSLHARLLLRDNKITDAGRAALQTTGGGKP